MTVASSVTAHRFCISIYGRIWYGHPQYWLGAIFGTVPDIDRQAHMPSPPHGKNPLTCSCNNEPKEICLRLLLHWSDLAASRADCTAGSNNEIKMPMIVITTKSSTSVNAAEFWIWRFKISFRRRIHSLAVSANHFVLSLKTTSTSLTEPDLWISHIRLFNRTHEQSISCVVMRAVLATCGIRLGARHTSPHPFAFCCQPLRVDSVSSPDITPTTPLLRVGPTAMPPYLFLAFSACWRLPKQWERHGSPKFRCKPLNDLPCT